MSGRAVRPSRSTSCWGCGPGASRPPYYKEVCVFTPRLARGQPEPPVTSMVELVACLDPAALARAWAKHPAEAALVKDAKDKLGDVQLRLANLAAAAGGLLDGQRLVDASDLLAVSLPTLANKADSEALFRIILSDVGHWITRKGGRPGLVTVDEFGSLDGGRGNRRRPAGARLISLRPHRARRAVLPLARRRGHLGPPYLQRRRPGPVRSATPTSSSAWPARCWRLRLATPPRMASGAAEPA